MLTVFVEKPSVLFLLKIVVLQSIDNSFRHRFKNIMNLSSEKFVHRSKVSSFSRCNALSKYFFSDYWSRVQTLWRWREFSLFSTGLSDGFNKRSSLSWMRREEEMEFRTQTVRKNGDLSRCNILQLTKSHKFDKLSLKINRCTASATGKIGYWDHVKTFISAESLIDMATLVRYLSKTRIRDRKLLATIYSESIT